MRKMLLLPMIVWLGWVGDLAAQTQLRTTISSRNVAPAISRPVVIQRNSAPVTHNLSSTRLVPNKVITIHLQQLTPAQRRAIENTVRGNNALFNPPIQAVENQSDHIAQLQSIVQSGTQGVAVQPGTGLGYSGPVVSEVQVALRRLGYYHGQVDGLFGSSTQEAVQAYQVATHRPATGLLDQSTLSTLGVVR
jgi:Putative peptidoglycan binding domain